jgi:hypothetical protein
VAPRPKMVMKKSNLNNLLLLVKKPRTVEEITIQRIRRIMEHHEGVQQHQTIMKMVKFHQLQPNRVKQKETTTF